MRFGSLGDDSGLVDISFDADTLSTPISRSTPVNAANAGPVAAGSWGSVSNILNGVLQAGLTLNSLSTENRSRNWQLQRGPGRSTATQHRYVADGCPAVNVGRRRARVNYSCTAAWRCWSLVAGRPERTEGARVKTEDVVTIAVLGFALYAMFGKALSKTPHRRDRRRRRSPL